MVQAILGRQRARLWEVCKVLKRGHRGVCDRTKLLICSSSEAGFSLKRIPGHDYFFPPSLR